MTLHLRPLTEEETKTVQHWSHSRTEAARLVERATIIRLASEGQSVPHIATTLGVCQKMVRLWLKRFSEQGVAGLQDAPRSGAPPRYPPEVVGKVVATALTAPRILNQPFACWTFERLAVYLREQAGITISQTRVFELLHREGLRWRTQETWFGVRVDPDFAQKRGR